VQDHFRLVNHVPAELYCVISGVSETVGLVEAPGPRVVLLHPKHELCAGRELGDSGLEEASPYPPSLYLRKYVDGCEFDLRGGARPKVREPDDAIVV
jgi:hypothetical protein